MPTVAEQFLRFLASSRDFQQSYAPLEGGEEVACELRTGSYQGTAGLDLLLCIGAESLYWSDFSQIETPEVKEEILYI